MGLPVDKIKNILRVCSEKIFGCWNLLSIIVPKIQNYWLNLNNIDAIYGKLLAYDDDLKELCNSIKNGQLDGLNITVPLKKNYTVFGCTKRSCFKDAICKYSF